MYIALNPISLDHEYEKNQMKPENEGYQLQSLFWRGPLSGSYGSFGEFLNIWGLQKVGKKCRYSGRLKGEQTELRYSLAKKNSWYMGLLKIGKNDDGLFFHDFPRFTKMSFPWNLLAFAFAS